MLQERNFWAESRDLYRFRDYIIKTWVESLPVRPIVIVDDDIMRGVEPLPEMTGPMREALDEVNAQIAKLMAVHRELEERRREYASR
jgi:hypothetical protein